MAVENQDKNTQDEGEQPQDYIRRKQHSRH
jgi:hypothetical protein